MKNQFIFCLVLLLLIAQFVYGEDVFTIARVRYDGGGDWYNDTSVIPNLCEELRLRTNIKAAEEQVIVSLTDNRIFDYPLLYLTGHGNVVFNEEEISNLRKYLQNGGFLYIDDDYGLDKSIRIEIKKLFPERKLQEIPSTFDLFNCFYRFPNGLPKIHKHDDKRPQAFGVFDDFGRMVILYTYESNISDGWASPNVHKDPENIRERAFKMGINIVYFVLTH